MSKKGSRQSLAELEAIDLDDALDEFPIGLGCALDLFREKDEVFEVLHSLPAIYTSQAAIEATYEKYTRIIDRYQEQPHLLDRHLEAMITVLLSQFRNSSNNREQVPLKHLCLKFLRQLFKVRGPKEVVKRMPHEIADLVPVLNYLEVENLDDPCTWESGYVLVMWLSILVINPFHLKLLDGQAEDKKDGLTIAERLMKVCQKCIVLNNNIGTAAPFLISRFLTRPDMQAVYMDTFIDWACKSLLESNPFGTRVGAFGALSAIFKLAKRQEILKYGEQVLDAVLRSKYEKCDTVLRKAGTKLIQRIGVMFMKTKMAPWRYQRGSRSLLCNLKGTTNLSETAGKTLQNTSESSSKDYEELNLYSSAIESVLDKLLEGLKDKDTVVRWSSAKGIGRVTNRLPKDYADEVMEGLLQNFSSREGNGAWHGGCLALAELARRGLLLPERIPIVIPVIQKAMVYDEIRGNFSVGAHVRDAACYVLWAFARAFEPHIIEPHVHDIATCLIITMLFDREVNCRRAASAAFQENVGRQGNFPFGIDIITVADYFAVGIRSNAYTKVSVEIGKYEVYTKEMIDHLMKLKFNHFDESVRELTAQALGNLAVIEPSYVKETVVPALVTFCNDSDTFTSHGALLSLGSIFTNFKAVNQLDFSEDIINSIRDIVPSLASKKFASSTRGNELLRQALNTFIDSCALSKMPYHNDETFISICHRFLEDHVSNSDNRTRVSAGKCFPHFLVEYYHNNPIQQDGKIKRTLESWCKHLNSSVMTARQGYALTLGRIPIYILKENFIPVINSLLQCCSITSDTVLWAESRKEALVALSSIFIQRKFSKTSNWEDGIPFEVLDTDKIFNSLLTAIDDYTTDKRGDIGSFVRKSAITTLKILSIRLNECGAFIGVDPSIRAKMMGLIAKQCVEKIDNVRVHAGQAFATLLHQKDPPMPGIPEWSAIMQIFPEDFCRSVNWRSTSAAFPKFVEMLALEQYTFYILEGFVISGGSLSDTVMKDANGAITNYLIAAGAIGDAELVRIGGLVNKLFENNLKNDRVTLPLMKFVTQLLQSGIFLPLLTEGADSFGLDLIELTKNELLKSGRVDKIVLAVELLCEMFQGGLPVIRSAMKKLTIWLAHVYPRVRVVTSQKVYEALLTYGGEVLGDQEKGEQIMNLLSETKWDDDLDRVRPVRNQICTILDIPLPMQLKPSSS